MVKCDVMRYHTFSIKSHKQQNTNILLLFTIPTTLQTVNVGISNSNFSFVDNIVMKIIKSVGATGNRCLRVTGVIKSLQEVLVRMFTCLHYLPLTGTLIIITLTISLWFYRLTSG